MSSPSAWQPSAEQESTRGSMDLARLFPVRPAFPGARWLLGFAILTVLLGAFWASGVFHEDPGLAQRMSWGPALFFCVIIAYIVPVFGYISERTVAALDVLSPDLETSPRQIQVWRRRICRKPRRWFAAVLLLGMVSGLIHTLLLNDSAAVLMEQASRSAPVTAVIVGTELTWIVVTLAVAALLDNAIVLNRAARCARPRLFDNGRLRPFATVAVLSTLALVGAQVAFPIMSLEGGVDPMAYWPGLLATGVPMLLLAALPVWPVHRRLAAAKRQILGDVNRQISALPAPDPDHPESLHRFTALLTYRREVAQLPEWPFDVGVMARLGLYLIIPPLTWVGAALIENVVDALL